MLGPDFDFNPSDAAAHDAELTGLPVYDALTKVCPDDIPVPRFR
jgi:hypothetical protein